MSSQGTEDINYELPLRVQHSEVKTEELLLLGADLHLGLLGQTEDVGEEEALLGDGQAGVLIVPGQLPLAQHAPLTLNNLSGQSTGKFHQINFTFNSPGIVSCFLKKYKELQIDF